ncbi:MAG: cytochrome c [Candidatus Lambdaproteobacteria bacterium]|nr:cytochrome c [Candidatus Lambdaproteobacteria bacterium]
MSQVLLSLFGVCAFAVAPVVGAEVPAVEKRIERLEQEFAKTKQREELALGREIYKAACMTCHGIKGDGRAPSAKWLDPKPRDFTKGLFKWRTTPFGALPTDEDLERVVREGISGTDMVPFGVILSKKNRMAVVQYIKTFSPNFADPALWPTAETIVKIPEQRPFEPSQESIAKGKALYEAKGCVFCHGPKGDGKGPAGANLVDAWGHPLNPWNFTHAYFKSGATDQDLYRTITTGLNGTPMISYAPLTTEEERWQLVDYIRSFGVAHHSISHYLFIDEPGGRVYEIRHSSGF